MKALKIAIITLLVVFALSSVGTASFLYAQSRNSEDLEESQQQLHRALVALATFQTELGDGLVEACEQSPVRETLTGMLQEQIEQSESPVIRELFGQTPKAKFAHIVAIANARKRTRIAELKPGNCAGLYPK
jgi:cob(I)alamin adenosyltransferase